MIEKEERTAFETWFRATYHGRLDRNMPDKSYNDPGAHEKWQAWQARASIATDRAQLATADFTSAAHDSLRDGDKLCTAPQPVEQAVQEPAFYVRDSAIAELKDKRVASTGAALHKVKGTGMVPCYASPQSSKVPDGFTLVAVKGLDDLVTALDRAQSKGYMHDAMTDEWMAFDFRMI